MRCSSAFDTKTALEFDRLKSQEDELSARVVEEFVKRAPRILKQILDETGLGRQITELGRGITEFGAKATEGI